MKDRLTRDKSRGRFLLLPLHKRNKRTKSINRRKKLQYFESWDSEIEAEVIKMQFLPIISIHSQADR